MARLFEVPQFFDNDGNPLSAGHLYWYQAGTSTPKLTWQDEAETTPHVLAYITLDGNGRAPGGAIFIRGSYKLIIKNSAETTTYITIDNINEYDAHDFTGLTATITDLNSTNTLAKVVSGTYTTLLADRNYTLLANAATADVTINLPSASVVGDTYKIWIKKTDVSTHVVNIVPFGSQTIDGADATTGGGKTLYDYNDFIECRSDGSNWKLGSALTRGTISNLSAAYTVKLQDTGRIFNCDNTAGNFTITLPSCVTVGRGFTLGFKKIDATANYTTILPSGTQTIDGAGTYLVNVRWQFIQIKSDGANWFIVVVTNSTTAAAVTGDVKATYQLVQNGWVQLNEGNIGNASSGATTRANADTHDLFVLLWNITNAVPTTLLVYSSIGAVVARGTSAINDFNANRRLDLPKATGRSLIQAGTAGIKTYVIGEKFGEEQHTMSATAEMPKHNHPGSSVNARDGGGGYFLLDTIGSSAVSADSYLTIADEGSSTPFNIIHPVTAVYYLIKL